MKRFAFAILGLLFLAATITMAGPTSTHTISITVAEITELDTSGSTINLDIDSATAGSDLTSATSSGTYDVTTNGSNKKITGEITSGALPTGLTLYVTMGEPTIGSGSSTGEQQVLDTSATDLVTGVSKAKGSSLTVDYRLEATVDADPTVAPESVTVEFTITN